MSIKNETGSLRDVPPFADLDPTKLELLAFVSERLVYPAGETVLKQGGAGDSVFVLIDGLLDVFISSGGSSSHVRELGRHAIFGEIAVIRSTARTATVVAKTDVVVLRISKKVLLTMIEDVPDLGTRITEHMLNAGYTFE